MLVSLLSLSLQVFPDTTSTLLWRGKFLSPKEHFGLWGQEESREALPTRRASMFRVEASVERYFSHRVTVSGLVGKNHSDYGTSPAAVQSA